VQLAAVSSPTREISRRMDGAWCSQISLGFGSGAHLLSHAPALAPSVRPILNPCAQVTASASHEPCACAQNRPKALPRRQREQSQPDAQKCPPHQLICHGLLTVTGRELLNPTYLHRIDLSPWLKRHQEMDDQRGPVALLEVAWHSASQTAF
jgi:hypothetical protein